MDEMYPVLGPDESDQHILDHLSAEIAATQQSIIQHGNVLTSANRGGSGSLSRGSASLGHRRMAGNRAFATKK